MPRVRAYLATSLDGFLAGPGDDLSWLPDPPPGEDFGFAAFLSGVGALLLGRRSYDVVAGFEGPWPYGALPVLVATHRPLTPKVPTVRAVEGPLEALLAEARAAAGEKDVYVDGGQLVRGALAAGALDELTLTLVPVVLGAGVPLFGPGPRRPLALRGVVRLTDELVRLTYEPAPPPAPRAVDAG